MNLITLSTLQSTRLINDIVIRPLKVNKDDTGILIETLRKDWTDIYGVGREFAMQYFSRTEPGVARDEELWHYHPTGQEDRFLVTHGEIVVAVADNRDESLTKGLLNLFRMHAENDPYEILIPKRTLHGFMVISETPAVLLNFPTRLYDPNEEGRVPYSEAQIKDDHGELFTWKNVRDLFPHLKQ